jgi:hypothetical protein
MGRPRGHPTRARPSATSWGLLAGRWCSRLPNRSGASSRERCHAKMVNLREAGSCTAHPLRSAPPWGRPRYTDMVSGVGSGLKSRFADARDPAPLNHDGASSFRKGARPPRTCLEGVAGLVRPSELRRGCATVALPPSGWPPCLITFSRSADGPDIPVVHLAIRFHWPVWDTQPIVIPPSPLSSPSTGRGRGRRSSGRRRRRRGATASSCRRSARRRPNYVTCFGRRPPQ